MVIAFFFLPSFCRNTFANIERKQFQLNINSEFLVVFLFDKTKWKYETEQKRAKTFHQIMEKFYKLDILNVNIVYHDYDVPDVRLKIYTYYPFALNSCAQVNLVLHNEFKNGSFSQKHPFYMKKLKEIYNCRLDMTTFDTPNSFEMILKRDGSNKITDFTGIEGHLLKLIIRKMNFKPNVISMPELWGEIYPNGTMTGAFRLLSERKTNFAIGLFHQTYFYYQFVDFSSSYYSTWFCFVTPAGRPYTSIEKLLRPFENIIWFHIIASILASFCLVGLMKCLAHRSTSKMVGLICNLDFIQIFLGLNLTRFPRGKFTKILIIVLMLTTLILRTVYQSSLVKFLTTAKRFEPIETIAVMIKANLQFYFMSQMSFLIDFIPGIASR